MNVRQCVTIVGIVAAFVLGIVYEKRAGNTDSLDFGEVRENSSNFTFINPLLECKMGLDYLSNGQARPSRAKLETLIDTEVKKGAITFVSVYYRDLNNGPWLGINEREQFFPASLMKVPLMMHYYKVAEEHPGILDELVAWNLGSISSRNKRSIRHKLTR
jgi:hypothetical protein